MIRLWWEQAEGHTPVSYTHLDVYKRQGEDCAICHQIGVCENLLKSLGLAGAVAAITAAFTSVSYTHLDVYKRQEFPFALSERRAVSYK